MKKKKDWQTKAKKRKLSKKDKGIVDFIRIIFHFFKDLPKWINEIKDPRNESYTTYTQSDLIFMGIMKNVCAVETMRGMDEHFNNEICIDTLSFLSGNDNLSEMPHRDSLNYYLSKLPPECLAGLRKKMVHKLIASRNFHKGRLLKKYWRVILDGTGLFYFKEKHCDNCLVETYTDKDGNMKKRYYHKVVEAKLVLSENIVISLGTEFIENESEDVEKQDCETNAAKRLLSRIRTEFPHLSICIQGDSLYETEPMMEAIKSYGWEYIFTHKSGRQKTTDEAYALLDKEDLKNSVSGIGKEHGVARYYNHVEKLTGKKEVMNIFEYVYEKCQEANGNEKDTNTFMWNASIEISDKNIDEMVHTARGRWKIENQGFNNQKNGIYNIEHLNSRNSNAMKNHYLLTQIADIIMQLYLAWNPLVRKIAQTIRTTSSRLLETFKQIPITLEDIMYIEKRTSIYLE